MQHVQQRLYQLNEFIQLDLKEYCMDLASTIHHNLCVGDSKVTLTFKMESVVVSPDTAILCGLALNELLTNALKYAFPGDGTGEIQIAIRAPEDGETELDVSDNGVGLPDNFDIEKTDTLGLQLVAGFVGQLKGALEIKKEQGSKFLIRFPNRL